MFFIIKRLSDNRVMGDSQGSCWLSQEDIKLGKRPFEFSKPFARSTIGNLEKIDSEDTFEMELI